MFENVTEDIQAFLLNTVFLPRMTSNMADALTGQSGSEEFLSKLYRDNFFINKHTGTEDYYQYHSLFREYLRWRGNKSLPNPTIKALQRKAAELLEAAGLIEDAADLYQQSGKRKPLVDLIIRNAPDLIAQGRHKTLHHWLSSLPNEIVFDDPWLLYWLATSIFPFNFAESRPFYEKAFYLFEHKNIAEGIILSICGIFYSIGYAFDSFEEFDKWLLRLRNCRLRFVKQLSNENKALITTCALYALVFRAPHHENSSEWKSESKSLLDQNMDLGIQIQLMLPLAYFHLFSGELPKAESLLKMFNQRATSGNITPFLQIILGNGNTFYYWLAADFKSCQASCNKTLQLAEATGIYGMNFFILAHGVAGALSTGDLKRAQELLDKMEPLLANVGAWSKGLFFNLSLWRDLITGDHVKANHDSDLALRYSEASGSPLTSATAHWAVALALNLVGKNEPADKKLDEALKLCEKFGSHQFKFGCLLTEARFAFDRNEDTKGKRALEKAFSLGSQKAFFNTFFWLSDVMSILCAKALAENIQVPYICEIIRKRQLRPTDDHLHLQNWPYPIRIYTLGRFDIHVNETPLIFKKKAPKKPISLLKTLVALGSREVSEDFLLDTLWPELDGDAAHSAFTSCLHRLRKLLGNEEAIRVQEGKVSINHRICWTDLWPYEKLLSQAENLMLDVADKNKQIEAVKLIEKIIAESKGVFLPTDSSPWIITKRERLKNKFLVCLRSLIQSYQAVQKWDEAVSAYNRGISVEPLAEDFYRGLMCCYKRLDQHADIISTYRICQSNLSTLAGLKPSQETVDLYRSLI